MLTRIISYGIIGALIVGSLMYTGSIGWASGESHQSTENGLVVGYLTQVIALTFVFLGVKAHRDNALGGVIKFLPAFGVGLAISAIASLGWVISWEIVLSVSHFDMGAMMKEQMVAQAQASGAGEAAIQKAIADADSFAKMYQNPLYRMPMSFIEMFPVGILVSLISAAVLRNSRFLPAGRPAVQG
ncbi:MAG TPA: DUF4199 domain-containing protein [Hyphomonadaceae bacterium]|jgi:hypothetical protein|nr:DUF4199 domain-containing protein [Hyphomonadaceae bacterium]